MKDGLDHIDRSLLSLLLVDGRASTSDLARQLGVGRTTVHDRIARLERTGVISGYAAILSGAPLGDETMAMVMISIVQKKQKQVLASLRSLPEITVCYTVTGDYDLMVMVKAPRLEDIDVLLDEIMGIDGVERCHSSLVLATQFQRERVAEKGPP